jgi:hypothetical protein
MVPDSEKFPFASVVPVGVLFIAPFCPPTTEIGAFGVAPEIVIVQVSPGYRVFPPRLVTKLSVPALVGELGAEAAFGVGVGVGVGVEDDMGAELGPGATTGTIELRALDGTCPWYCC